MNSVKISVTERTLSVFDRFLQNLFLSLHYIQVIRVTFWQCVCFAFLAKEVGKQIQSKSNLEKMSLYEKVTEVQKQFGRKRFAIKIEKH